MYMFESSRECNFAFNEFFAKIIIILPIREKN
jgi:hypothetical protein